MTRRGNRRHRKVKQANPGKGAQNGNNSPPKGDKIMGLRSTTEGERLQTPAGIQTPNDQNNNSEHSNNERNLVRLTGGLLFVGVITFLILVVHACIFVRADETARAGLRASVGMIDVVVRLVGETDQAPIGTAKTMYSVAALWKNSGHTATKNLVIDNNTRVYTEASDPIFPDLDAAEAEGKRRPFKTTLAPETTMTGQVNFYNGTILEAAKDKTKVSFYVFGIATYEDVFGDRHLTLACHQIISAPIDYISPKSTMIENHSTLCREYNCTDQECRRYQGVPQIAKLLEYLE